MTLNLKHIIIGNKLPNETILSERLNAKYCSSKTGSCVADAIAAHEPLRAQDAMYLHLVYNRKRIQMIKKGDLI